MEYRTLGPTGKDVFVIGFGTYGLGGAYGPVSKHEALVVMRTVINESSDSSYLFIDTAPTYGNGSCEEWLGEVLRDFKNERILVATKGGRHIDGGRVNEKDFSPEFLISDLEGSLTRLSVDEIFLYQLHNPSIAIIEEGSVFDLLEEFRTKGKIRYYGVSIDDPKEGILAMEICKKKGYTGLASLQVIYNILQKRAETRLFDEAKEHGVAIIAREPLLRWFLTDRFSFTKPPPAVQKVISLYGEQQLMTRIEEIKTLLEKHGLELSLSHVALKFVISNPHVTVAIPGMNRIEYVRSNLAAALFNMDDAIRADLKELYDLHELQSHTQVI